MKGKLISIRITLVIAFLILLQPIIVKAAVSYSSLTSSLPAMNGNWGNRMIFGDFNCDGYTDLLYQDSNVLGGNIKFWDGQTEKITSATSGKFTDGPFNGITFTYIAKFLSSCPYLQAMDYDNDGDIDLVEINPDVTTRLLINNNGIFSVDTTTKSSLPQMKAYCQSRIIFGDFNCDGYVDALYQNCICTSSSTPSDLKGKGIYFRDGQTGNIKSATSGTFGEGPFDKITFTHVNPLTATNYSYLTAVDYDNDGDLDLVEVNNTQAPASPTATRILKNNGDGTFSETSSTKLPTMTGRWAGVVGSSALNASDNRIIFGDFNSDGYVDALYQDSSKPTNNNIYFQKGIGNGDFDEAILASDSSSPFMNASVTNLSPFLSSGYYNAVDYDNDGDLDLVQGNSGSTKTITQSGSTRISSSTPANNSVDFSPTGSIILDFDQSIASLGPISRDVGKPFGNIYIKKVSDDSVVATIAANDLKVTGMGTSTITINPGVTLDENTKYYILIDKRSFFNSDGQTFMGIKDKTKLRFTTGSLGVSTAPLLRDITVKNNTEGTSDTIAVANVPSGATVKLYDATETQIGTEQNSESSAVSKTITVTQLGTESGKVYVTITQRGKTESTPKTEVTYIAEPLAPSITANPVGANITEGNNTSFTVTATGTGLTYQWMVDKNDGSGFANVTNDSIYSGAVTDTLTISNATTSMSSYKYKVVVSGVTGTPASSTEAKLTVNVAPAAPSITIDISSKAITEGNNTSFKVMATGTGLNYQWMVDKNDESGFVNVTNDSTYGGALTDTLTITNATTSMSSYKYKVVVSGITGTPVNSTEATLTVNAAPVAPSITTNPVGANITEGNNTSFNVTATGTGLNYQWMVDKNDESGFVNVTNDSTYGGASTDTLTITNATTSMSSYKYKVVVSGVTGTPASSTEAKLTVNASPVAPSITTNPVGANITEGNNTSFTVTATGTGLNYHWMIDKNDGIGFVNVTNDSIYVGATSETLSITNATTAMSGYKYKVVVSGTTGSPVNSTEAILTVNAAVVAPSITTNPVGANITEGNNTSFNVSATGTGLNYQWMVDKNDGSGFVNVTNDSIYGGATSETLSITNVTTAMSGYKYKVVVSGTTGSPVNSTEAKLTVNAAKSDEINIKSVETLDNINVDFGKDINQIGLAKTVNVELSNGVKTSAAVTWNSGDPNYDKNKSGTYKFTGILEVLDNILNPGNLEATVSVTVGSEKVTTGAAVKVSIDGTAKDKNTLTAKVVDENGKTVSSDVQYAWYRVSSTNGYETKLGTEKTYTLSSDDVGYYIKLVVTYDNKPYDELTSKVVAKGSSSSSSSSSRHRSKSSSSTSSSSIEKVTVKITDGNSDKSVSQTVIERTAVGDGNKKDTVTYTADNAQQAVAILASEGKDTARIIATDSDSAVSQTQVSIPKDTLFALSSGNINLEIETNGAIVSVPKESVQGLVQSEQLNEDLYFRLVPIKDEAKQKEIKTTASKEAEIKAASGNNEIQVLGTPMTIETNMSQRNVDIILPLTGVTLPADESERKEFFNDLGVFVEHSDGEKVFQRGTVVGFKPGVFGVKFTVTKFSNFTIVKLNNQSANSIKTGWKFTDDYWYFIENDGTMAKGWHKAKSGEWTYDKKDTVDTWFHLESDGKMDIGWFKDTDGSWYYLCNGSNYGTLGVMETGWECIDGTWYFLKDNGAMATNWQEINGIWYYFNSNGSMAANTTIDGYTLDENGAWKM